MASFRALRLQGALYQARKRNHAAHKAVAVNDLTQAAWGTIVFAANPLSNATITIGGTVVTFGTNVTIGANLAATLANLLTFLQASANVNLVKATYAITDTALHVRAKTLGAATLTLAASVATVSAATVQFIKTRQRKKL